MYCACACVSACVCVYACVYVFPANLANLERLEQLEKERARQHQKNLLSQVGGMAGVERVWFSPHRGSDGEEGAGESVGGVPNRERVEAERVGGSVRGAGGGGCFVGGVGSRGDCISPSHSLASSQNSLLGSEHSTPSACSAPSRTSLLSSPLSRSSSRASLQFSHAAMNAHIVKEGGGTMVGDVKDRGAATWGGTDRVEQSKSDIQSSTVVTTSNSMRALSSPQTLHTNQFTHRSLSPTDLLLQPAFSPTNTLLQPTSTTYSYHQPTHRLPSPTHSRPPRSHYIKKKREGEKHQEMTGEMERWSIVERMSVDALRLEGSSILADAVLAQSSHAKSNLEEMKTLSEQNVQVTKVQILCCVHLFFHNLQPFVPYTCTKNLPLHISGSEGTIFIFLQR